MSKTFKQYLSDDIDTDNRIKELGGSFGVGLYEDADKKPANRWVMKCGSPQQILVECLVDNIYRILLHGMNYAKENQMKMVGLQDMKDEGEILGIMHKLHEPEIKGKHPSADTMLHLRDSYHKLPGYQKSSIRVPFSYIEEHERDYEDPMDGNIKDGGYCKVAEFIQGEHLGRAAKKDASIHNTVNDAFIYHCLVGNYDWAGSESSLGNVLVTLAKEPVKGEQQLGHAVYLIDNGSSLHFKARGGLKDGFDGAKDKYRRFGADVDEIKTLRDEKDPISGVAFNQGFFSKLDKDKINQQIDNVLSKEKDIVTLIKNSELTNAGQIAGILTKRIKYLDEHRSEI